MITQSFLWIKVLKQSRLHIAYQLTSLTIVLNIFYAFFLFNEKISHNQIIGISVIVIGVIMTVPKSNESFL